MSVRLRNNKWTVDFYLNGRKGKRIQLTLPDTVKTREEALEHEKHYKRIQKEETVKVNTNSSISQHSPTFFEYCDMHLAPKTSKDIQSCFKNHILPILGSLRANFISLSHFHMYKKRRLDEKGSNVSINKEINYIGSFYKWGKKYDILSGIPFKVERLPYKRPIPYILSFEETIEFIKAATPDIYRVLFLTIYNLGLRLDEAIKLKWSNVDLNNRTITVKERAIKKGVHP